MRTLDNRMKRTGDLWAALRQATGIDLLHIEEAP